MALTELVIAAVGKLGWNSFIVASASSLLHVECFGRDTALQHATNIFTML